MPIRTEIEKEIPYNAAPYYKDIISINKHAAKCLRGESVTVEEYLILYDEDQVSSGLLATFPQTAVALADTDFTKKGISEALVPENNDDFESVTQAVVDIGCVDAKCGLGEYCLKKRVQKR